MILRRLARPFYSLFAPCRHNVRQAFKQRGAHQGADGLTPRSSRTLPALPTSMSHGSDIISPLTAQPPAGPVSFFR